MKKGKVTEKKEKNLFICFLELLFDSLACPEDIDFHLFFRDVEDCSNIFVALALNVSQLHTATLLLRELVDKLSDQPDAVTLDSLLLWISMMAAVGRFHLPLQGKGLVSHVPGLIQREVSADGQTKSLHIVYRLPAVTTIPHLDHRFLYNILRLRRIESDAESQPVEFFFQWQDIVSETDTFHLGYYLIIV